MRASASAALALALLGSPLVGCGESESSLSGSIGRTHPLGYQTVELRRLDSSYVVAYLRGAETVARLTFTPAGAVAPGPAGPPALPPPRDPAAHPPPPPPPPPRYEG